MKLVLINSKIKPTEEISADGKKGRAREAEVGREGNGDFYNPLSPYLLPPSSLLFHSTELALGCVNSCEVTRGNEEMGFTQRRAHLRDLIDISPHFSLFLLPIFRSLSKKWGKRRQQREHGGRLDEN